VRNVSEKICIENYNTFLWSAFVLENHAVWDNVEICVTAGQAVDDNMAHALCMPDT
jgi:hypothetical protein